MSIYKNGQQVLGSVVNTSNFLEHIADYTDDDASSLDFNNLTKEGIYTFGINSAITNSPKGVTLTYGNLKVTKYKNEASYFIGQEYTLLDAGTPTIYIRRYVESTDEWGDWYKVSNTTSATDVDKTITITQNLSAGIVSYFIKDGMCYVSVSSITPSSDGGSTIGVANSLPIPNAKGINHYTLGTTSGNSGLFIINTDGSITFYGKSTLSYFGQFSYPVAE